MSLISVDVESDGPVPGIYSMVCFGAVVVEPKLDRTFYGELAPISDNWKPEALAISGFNREEHLTFENPSETMFLFKDWLKINSTGRPVLVADNNGFDAAWINYYFHLFLGENPFGWSSRRIGDLFCGAEHNLYYKWKQYRNNAKYPHNHNPVSDSLSNATALLYFAKKYNVKLPK